MGGSNKMKLILISTLVEVVVEVEVELGNKSQNGVGSQLTSNV